MKEKGINMAKRSISRIPYEKSSSAKKTCTSEISALVCMTSSLVTIRQCH